MPSPALGQLPPDVTGQAPCAAGRAFVERLAAAECPALTTRRARRAERSGASDDPIVWAQAADCNVVDVDGQRYVDLSAGFGAAAVGHCHPQVVQAVGHQSKTLMHALGDLHPSDVKVRLLERLAQLGPFEDGRVILGLHGADAVEAALKTAVLHTGRPGVLAFVGGYHGLSHGPLALCGYSAGFRAPFLRQLNPHVTFAPYPSSSADCGQALAAVEKVMLSSEQLPGAVVVEPILGRGGVILPPEGFIAGLSDLCRRHGVLMVADEIMTGLGRAGSWFSSVAAGAQPDLVCLGKALGGGLPTSACIGSAEVMAAWGTPDKEALHTATFLGNPLLASAALAALDVLTEQALPERAAAVGGWLVEQLQQRVGGAPQVVQVRGQGLLVGIELSEPMAGLSLMQKMLRRGYITVPAGESAQALSLTPPLTIGHGLLEGFLDSLAGALADGSEEAPGQPREREARP